MIKQQLISTDYKPFAEKIERYFSQSSVILQDDRNIIKEVEFDNKVFVVKSYKVPGVVNSFIYTYFRKSKAWRAYEYGLKITEFTPRVVARIEYYQPLLGKSYLICEKFDADFNMQIPLLSSIQIKTSYLNNLHNLCLNCTIIISFTMTSQQVTC